MKHRLFFAEFFMISLCLYCFGASTFVSADGYQDFYDDYLCEEKEVLSAVGLSSPLIARDAGQLPILLIPAIQLQIPSLIRPSMELCQRTQFASDESYS